MEHLHPLATMITEAAEGRFPPADGGWHRVPLWREGLEGVVSFTAHSVLAVGPDVTDRRLTELGADGLGGADHPRLITALAGPGGWIDSLDMLLAAHGTASAAGAGGTEAAALVDRPDLADHQRAQFAARIRDPRQVLGYTDRRRSALAILSTGLAGLTELSFELEPGRRGGGQAAPLIRAALATVPPAELVVAAVAPGNAASVRALLTAGFAPVGSLHLWRPAR